MPHCCKLSALKKECNCQEKLPEMFVPGNFDVICARGKQAKTHPGNVRYQQIVESYMDRYVSATSKLQKMSIISEIVTKVRFSSPNGGFVKLKDGRWYEVGDHFAREKVSQSLRDNLHVLYRSSCKSKTIRRAIRRRQDENQREFEEVIKRTQMQHQNSMLPTVCSSFPSQLQAFVSNAKSEPVPQSTPSSLDMSSAPKTDAELMVARILLAQAHQSA